jgi:hypothetical protein
MKKILFIMYELRTEKQPMAARFFTSRSFNQIGRSAAEIAGFLILMPGSPML